MSVLGFSSDGARPPTGCHILKVEQFSVVLPVSSTPLTGREQLSAQLACLNDLDAFVPFSAGSAPEFVTVENWLLQHGAAARSALEALRGRGQLTFMARHNEKAIAPEQGKDFLRSRARHARTVQDRATALQDHLIEFAKTQGDCHHTCQQTSNGLRFDLLVPLEQAAQMCRAWASYLASPTPHTDGWRANLTGAWPATAFWRLEETP